MSTLSNTLTPTTRWLIIIAVMSATLMQVLDTTIVNVALPHMQGNLSANSDEITWTLTSYLVASGIFTPLTGFFTDKFGRKKYLLMSIGGFTLASALCGAATSLPQMIIFRLLQGMFGAALVPLSQAILADIFPKEELGKAMSLWGVGVMVGPILGPTLGGYLTEVASWRWTFYVNLPVGIISFFLAWYIVPDSVKRKHVMDWPGFFLIAIAIGAMQYLFDRGNQEDWFNSNEICLAALLIVVGLVGFLIRNLLANNHSPVFDLRIFRDRNFSVASLLLAVFGLGLYGSMVILPLFLENLLNYPVLTAGLVMAPRGISSMVSMLFVGKMIKRMDPRYMIGVGAILTAIGAYACTFYSQNIDPFWVVWPLVLQGFGLGMIFVPLSAVAFATLPEETRAEAAGLFSLMRTLGGSIGISIAITLYTRHTQIAWNYLSGFVNPYNSAVNNYLQPLHLSMQNNLAMAVLGKEIAKQAGILATINVFAFIVCAFIIMLPLLLLFRYKASKNDQADLPISE